MREKTIGLQRRKVELALKGAARHLAVAREAALGLAGEDELVQLGFAVRLQVMAWGESKHLNHGGPRRHD